MPKEGGDANRFPPFKTEVETPKFYPVLRREGAQRVLDSQFSHFVAPLPIINDRSLRHQDDDIEYLVLRQKLALPARGECKAAKTVCFGRRAVGMVMLQ